MAKEDIYTFSFISWSPKWSPDSFRSLRCSPLNWVSYKCLLNCYPHYPRSISTLEDYDVLHVLLPLVDLQMSSLFFSNWTGTATFTNWVCVPGSNLMRGFFFCCPTTISEANFFHHPAWEHEPFLYLGLVFLHHFSYLCLGICSILHPKFDVQFLLRSCSLMWRPVQKASDLARPCRFANTWL